MANTTLRTKNFVVDPFAGSRGKDLQYNMIKAANSPSLPVKRAFYRQAINSTINSEYNRLRQADNAGIRFKMFRDYQNFQERHANRMYNLRQQRLDLEEKQDDDAMKGALIGGLLGTVGIGINAYQKSKLEKQQEALADIHADMLETEASTRIKEGTLEQDQYSNAMRMADHIRNSAKDSGLSIDYDKLMFWR